MSKTPAWAVICLPESTTLLDTEKFVVPSEDPKSSPIDDLIGYIGSVMPLGSPEQLARSDVLGRVLLLALVSGAETYFRAVLTRLLTICPICRAHVAEQMIAIGAIDYYGKDNLGLGLLEGISLASKDEILKQTSRLSGITWKENSSVAVAIRQFETLSQLRHAAVHARGELGVRNLQAIGATTDVRRTLVVRFPQLQDAAQVCINAARAYNRHVFQQVVQRWISRKKLGATWTEDRVLFTELTTLFISREDRFGGARHKEYLYGKLQPSVASALAGMAHAAGIAGSR